MPIPVARPGLRTALVSFGLVVAVGCSGSDRDAGLEVEDRPTPSVPSTTVVPPVEEPSPGGRENDVRDSGLVAETIETGADEVITLAMIGAQRANALADLDGFTATHTIESLRGNRTFVEVQEVTALADGRVWTEGERGSWSAIDPASGRYRAAHVGAFGGTQFQELTDRTAWALGGIELSLRGGAVPTAPIDGYDDGRVTIERTSLGGRASWTIFARDESDEYDTQSETTWAIDIETGLIVEYTFSKWEDGPDGDEHRFRSSLTDLRPAEGLPADFPRPFPEDAVVDRQPDFDYSGGRRPVTLEAAATGFNPGLVVPVDLPDDATVLLYDRGADNPGSSTNPDHEEVTVTTGDGFDVTTITVTKFIPIDGLTLTRGEVQCYDIDQDERCDNLGVRDTIEQGALSGREVWVDGSGVIVADAGRTVRITNVDPARARELAEAFINI